MSDFVEAMGTYLSSEVLWNAVSSVAPLIGAVLVFTIGYTIARRVLKGGSHGHLRV